MNLKSLLQQAEDYEHSLPEFPGGLDVEGKALAGYFDSTILTTEATIDKVYSLCEDARKYNVAAVCINPIYASRATRFLKGSEVKNCCVVGFPLGATPTLLKVTEATYLLKEGVEEIDMVIPVGMLKSGMYGYVYDDIASVAAEAQKHKAHSKIILEMGLLTLKEKIIGCLLSKAAGREALSADRPARIASAIDADADAPRGLGTALDGGRAARFTAA